MKTVVTEITEALNTFNSFDFYNWMNNNIDRLKDKEKQHIIDAATHGANFDKSPYSSAYEYYERTYTKNKENLK